MATCLHFYHTDNRTPTLLAKVVSQSRLMIACLLLCYSSTTFAHDYWFESDGDNYRLYRGHRFSQHQGEQQVAFDPSIINQASCLSNGANELHTTGVQGEYPPRINGPCQALIVSLDSGYWSQTLTGTRNQPKDELFAVLRSWQALETVKLIERWSPRITRAFGNELELVPQANPFTLFVDDKLRLTATLNGKPVAGVQVAYDGDPRGITAQDGHINLKIRHAGLQVISASLERPLNTSKADKQVRSTVLMFTLPSESR